MDYAATSWDGELSENSWTGEPEELAGAQPVVIGSGTVFDELKGFSRRLARTLDYSRV